MKVLLPLGTTIQAYDWGSREVLSAIRSEPPSASPEAELWVGAHPAAESTVDVAGVEETLSTVVGARPGHWLGEAPTRRFGAQLPFLMKILAVDRPLSLQAHPDVRSAIAGFEREEVEGARARIYVDRGHKPEVIVALEPLWALRGLRPAADVRRDLGWLHELSAVTFDTLELGRDFGPFLRQLLRMPAVTWERVAARARARLPQAETDDPADPWFWVGVLMDLHPEDPACLSPLFLHLVALAPGQALYQGPGTLHCYLRGVGVEAMASSDNVLRAGLTSKPLALDEMLSVCDLLPEPPGVIDAVGLGAGVRAWPTPAEEFQLVSLTTDDGAVTWCPGGAITLGVCVAGGGRIRAGDDSLIVSGGDAFVLAAAADELALEADRPTTVFCATVPR